MNEIEKYAAIFGRAPYLVKDSDIGVRTAFFPAIDAGFFKSLMSEGVDQNIYITAGLSRYEMKAPSDLSYKPETKVELVAQTNGQITSGATGEEDVVSELMPMIASYIIEERIFIEPGHTLDFQERIATNSEMSAFLFSVPEGFDVNRVRKACKSCQALVSLIPISVAELEYTRKNGVGALIDIFEENNVPPLFDPFRSSAI